MNLMPEVQDRRRQYIVYKLFQFKFIYILVALLVVTVGAAHGLASWAAKWLVKDLSMVQAAAPVPVSVNIPWEIFGISVLITIILGTVLVLILGMIYSHRIAGPMFSLKRVLERVSDGDLTTVMHIRAKDEFHDVEASVNQMLTGLKQKCERLRKTALELPEPHKTKILRVIEDSFRI